MSADPGSRGSASSGQGASPSLPERAMAVLSELVRLKDLKDRDGENDDYRLNKDRAWEDARQVLAQNLQSSRE